MFCGVSLQATIKCHLSSEERPVKRNNASGANSAPITGTPGARHLKKGREISDTKCAQLAVSETEIAQNTKILVVLCVISPQAPIRCHFSPEERLQSRKNVPEAESAPMSGTPGARAYEGGGGPEFT